MYLCLLFFYKCTEYLLWFHSHCIPDSLAVPIKVPEILKDAFYHDGFNCDNEHDGIFECRACPVGTYGNRVDHGCVNCPAGKGWWYNFFCGSTSLPINVSWKSSGIFRSPPIFFTNSENIFHDVWQHAVTEET